MDEVSQSSGTHLLDLPNETLIYIFEFLSFEEVAKFRIVCKRIDDICQKILNCGFQRAAQLHAAVYKQIKARLPRRESERRNHALSRHADILTSIETRISMLSMTYSKYIDLKMCCFIPGRVLDEIFRILRLTTRTCIPLRPLEILQEFRDISSMAIEHFDEKIASEFKKVLESTSLSKMHSISGIGHSHVHGIDSSSINCIRRISLSTTDNLPSIIKDSRRSRSHFLQPTFSRTTKASIQRKMTIRNLNHRIITLQRSGVQQKKRLTFCIRKLNSLSSQMSVMKRRVDELESKNQDLIGTLRQYNLEEVQAETVRTTSASEKTKSREISPSNEILSDTQNVTDEARFPVITDPQSPDTSSYKPSSVRTPVKRHFSEVFTSNEEDIELIPETVEKKAKI